MLFDSNVATAFPAVKWQCWLPDACRLPLPGIKLLLSASTRMVGPKVTWHDGCGRTAARLTPVLADETNCTQKGKAPSQGTKILKEYGLTKSSQ